MKASARMRALPGGASSSRPSSWLVTRARAGVAQQALRRPLGHERRGAAAGRKQHLAVGVDDGHVLRRELLAQALEGERLHFEVRLGHTFARRSAAHAGLGRQVADLRVEGGAAEVQAGVERARDLHVEPAFDAARDELVAHGVDQHAGDHADQREDGRELEQQPAAELAALHADQEAHRGDADHQHQEAGHRGVDPEQPGVVALVEGAVAGGDRQQEREHQHRAGDRDQRDQPCPAVGLGHVN
jgi:hypothetical protein